MTGDGANDVPIMTITTDNIWLDPQPVLYIGTCIMFSRRLPY